MGNQFKTSFIKNLRSRFSAATLAFALIIGSGVALIEAAPAIADPCPSGWTFVGVNCERTYVYTGASQTFTVPNGVRNISFTAAGGRGALAPNTGYALNQSAPAVVSGILPTNGGETLNINVGGAGTSLKGGWNGGGDGAIYTYSANLLSAAQLRDYNSSVPGRGGGGGGATDIRVGGTGLNNRVAVAGGGGGGAFYYLCYPQGWLYYEDRTPQNAYCTGNTYYPGGSAINEASANLAGLGPTGITASTTVGGQATMTAGGAKGALAPQVNYTGCDAINYSTAGTLGQGGHGGALQRSSEPNYRVNGWNYESCPAGGGGGGYYGGGGAVYGGGGGGSSYLSTAIKTNTASWEGSFVRPPADSFVSGDGWIKKWGTAPVPPAGTSTTTITSVEDLAPTVNGARTSTVGASTQNGWIRMAYRGTTILSVNPVGLNADGETTSKALDFDVTFAEAVTGFDTAKLSVSGASGSNGTWTYGITNLNGTSTSASQWRVTATNTSAIDGEVTLNVTAAGTTSVSSVPGLGTMSATAKIDTTGPAMASVRMSPPSTKSSPVDFIFTFDEVISFVGGASDDSKLTIKPHVTGDTVTPTAANWTTSVRTIDPANPNKLTVRVTYPNALTSADSGELTLEIAAGYLEDALGNDMSVAVSGTSIIDYTPPVLTQANIATPTNTAASGTAVYVKTSAFAYTLTFNEDVRHLYASNDATATKRSFGFGTQTATGCVATPAASETTNRQVVVNVTGCTDGTVVLKVLSGKLEDMAGNATTFGAGNALVGDVTAVTVNKDTVAPTWASSNPFVSSSALNATTIDINVNFGGPVYGLTANDLDVTYNASVYPQTGIAGWSKTITSGTDGSSSYVFRIQNTDAMSGTVDIKLPAAAATDIAGNPTTASSTISRTLDFVPELSLGTLNGLSGASSVVLAPNAAIKFRGGRYDMSGFRVVIKNAKTGDTLAMAGANAAQKYSSTLSTVGSDKVFDVTSSGGNPFYSAAALQEAIRSVQFSTTSTDRTARTIEFTIKPNSEFMYETRHFYVHETNAGAFADTSKGYAQGVVNGRTMAGARAYLPTITSAAENAKVKATGQDSPLWLGGRNSGENWTWNQGPENGTKFTHEPQVCLWLVGCSDDAFRTGWSEAGRYNNWQKDLFGNNAEPNNRSGDIFKSADDISMNKAGEWEDGLVAFANISIVAEYGNQLIGDSYWDTKLFVSTSIAFDSTPPTLTLAATANLVNDKAIFNLTGNESIDCSTLTAADVTTTGIDVATIAVKQVSPVACEISAAHTLTAGVQGTITLTKSTTFSVKDAAGNAATAVTNGSNALTITATPPAPVTPVQQNTAVTATTYNLTPPSEQTTGFTQTDPAAKSALDSALTQAKIVEPPVTAPEKKGERDISSLPTTARYELSDEITVIQGTNVGADFKVSNGRRNTHEAWGYIRIGTGDWLSLGKQALTASGQADLASIGKMAFTQVGTYQLKIVVVPSGVVMPARVLQGAAFRPPVKAAVAPTGGISFKRAAVTDSQLNGVGDDSYQLTVNVTPSSTAPNVVVVAPNVSSVQVLPSTGNYKVGDIIEVKVNFSAAVDVTGVPQVRFNLGGTDNYATYSDGTGTNQLTFSYSVQPTDNTGDFDYAGSNSLELNGGTIVQAGASTNAMLGLPTPGADGSISFSSAIVVDNIAPKVSLSAEDNTANSATLTYLLTSETPLDCSTVSSTSGVDFVFTGISAITGVVQTTATKCTITATSSIAAGQTGTSSLAFADNFSVADSAGNSTLTTDLVITSASIAVTVPSAPTPPSGGSSGGTGGSGGSGSGGSTGGGTGGTTPGTGSGGTGSGGSGSGGTSGGGSSSGSGSGSGSAGSGSSGSGSSGSGSTSGSGSSASGSGSSGTSSTDGSGSTGSGTSGSSGSGSNSSGANSDGNGSGSGDSSTNGSNQAGSNAIGEALGNLLADSPLGDLLGTEPGSIGAAITDLFAAPELPTPGEPVANPALGASGDDNAPAKPFNPMASPESAKAVTEVVSSIAATVAVAAVAGAAAAAAAAAGAAVAGVGAAAGAAGAAGAGAASAAGSAASAGANAAGLAAGSAGAGTASAGSSASGTSASGSSGSSGSGSNANMGSASATIATRLNARGRSALGRFAARVGRVSPLLSKIINSSAYLQLGLGKFYAVIVLISAGLSAFAAIQNGGDLLPPAWPLFIALAVIALFDAFAGAIGFAVFAAVSIALAGLGSSEHIALLIGIGLVWLAPGLLAKEFRSRQANAASRTFDLVTQIVIAALLAGWVTTAAVATLPALAHSTLVVANHAIDFGIAIAIAAAVRVLVEEIIARSNPALAESLLSAGAPQTTWLQKIVSWLLRLGVFAMVAGVIFGFSAYTFIGALLFVLPTALGWFADRLPNSAALWRVLPTGLVNLNLVLVITAITSSVASGLFTGQQAAAQTFMLLPVPLLVLAILGMFGRHGSTTHEVRPILKSKYVWLYRIGGAIMFVIALKLTGIL